MNWMYSDKLYWIYPALISGLLTLLLYFINHARKKAAQLEEEHVRFKASINSLNIGFIITDTQFNILTANGAARRTLCFKEGAINPGIVRNLTQISANCTMEDIEAALSGVFDLRAKVSECLAEKKTIEVQALEFRNLFLHIFITPIVMLKGDSFISIGAVILVEDITQQQAIDRSRDDFFSIASHELRTPLTAIRGNTSMLKQFYADKLKDPDFTGMVEDIHEASIRLIEIVSDFLDVSRLEQGRIQFHPIGFSLPPLIFEVFKELNSVAAEKNLTLFLDEQNIPNCKVYADSNRVKQVLINLVGNALKYTDRGGITVKLKAGEDITNISGITGGVIHENKRKFLTVSIIDTGRGIPAQNQNLLFKKFQQAAENPLTRDSTRGTGLGLYISKLMIEGMGGDIYLENSEVGKGSTFGFTLPIYVPGI